MNWDFAVPPVAGLESLSVYTAREYEEHVKRLDTKGHPQDSARKRRRKELLLLMDMKPGESGFTQGALTQTSHLVRLAARQIAAHLPHLGPQDVVALPGQVTAQIRKAWDVMGCLMHPDVCGDEVSHRAEERQPDGTTRAVKRLLPKEDIRGRTHLHHAVDATVLGLSAVYLPKNSHHPGGFQSGARWRAMLARTPNREEAALLESCTLFRKSRDEAGKTRYELQDTPASLKGQICLRLSEKRVVQHIPADMHGVKAELNTWRVIEVHGDPEDPSTEVSLRQWSCKVENGRRIRKRKDATEKAGKLLGLNPENGEGKLKQVKGVLVVNTNYGLALDPEPTILPFHRVWHQLQNLKMQNAGISPRVLRNGMLIKIESSPTRSRQDYSGMWVVKSVKDNKSGIALDIIRPHFVKPSNGVKWSGMNKTLEPLLKAGLSIVDTRMTGVDCRGK